MLVASTAIFWNSKSIFLLLRQPPEVVHLSSEYLKVWSIGSPAFVLYTFTLPLLIYRFESFKRYMQCQGKMQVPTYVLLFCVPMNAAMNYLFVWHTSLGFIGAPTATVITHWTMAISLMVYAGIYGSQDAWPGWSWHIFEDWKSWKYMMHLAGSGIIMICSEVWSWEVVIIASSFLGVKSLAANSILQVCPKKKTVEIGHGGIDNPNSNCRCHCDLSSYRSFTRSRSSCSRKKSKPCQCRILYCHWGGEQSVDSHRKGKVGSVVQSRP